MNTDKGIQDPLTERILKGCFEVMANLGHGFAEVIYQRALTLELQEAGLQLDREVRFPVVYKSQEIGILLPIQSPSEV